MCLCSSKHKYPVFCVHPEFLEVGKKQPALDVLYDVIKSKKHRTWQKIHEPIMLKYLELCVDLRKSHLAKEGLYQYKNICQQVCVKGGDTDPVVAKREARIQNLLVCVFRSTSSHWRMLSEPTWSWQKTRQRLPKESPSKWFWTLRIWITFRLQKGNNAACLDQIFFYCVFKCVKIMPGTAFKF